MMTSNFYFFKHFCIKIFNHSIPLKIEIILNHFCFIIFIFQLYLLNNFM